IASSGGRHGDLVAEGLEPVGEPSADVLAVALVEVVGTEGVERLATPQDGVSDDELAEADGDGRPLATSRGRRRTSISVLTSAMCRSSSSSRRSIVARMHRW